MSLSDTKEKSNGSKLSRLLIDGGTKVLRSTFDGIHPPATLSGTLNLNRGVLNSLRGRVLNSSQWCKLFPPGPGAAPPDSKNFDITLLFILLRNICGLTPPSTGWNKLPPTTDTTLEANLARIKYFRNEVYGHISSTSIDDSKFESLWRDISSPLVALGLRQNEVDLLKYEMTSTDYIALLKEWSVQDQDLKEEILETRLVAEKSFEVLQQIKAEKTVPSFDYTELSSKMKGKILASTETLEEIYGQKLKTDTIFTKVLLHKGQIEHSLDFEKERENLLSYTEDASTNKIIEQAYQLFLPDEDTENPKLILLTGRAGIGKTMFSMKLVRDWASNSLFPGVEVDNKYKFVFHYFFRQLNEIDQPLSLFDFLNLSQELDASEFDFVCKNPEQTLIVMDGLDEFKYKDRLDKLVPRQDKQSIAAICSQILNRSVLNGATVVVTSRPESKQLIKFDRKAEILGFKQKDVEEYFKRFFGSKGETANIVLRHVKENANVAGLCYVPVNCYIICTYFQWHLENQHSSTEEYKLPSTVTELYQGILQMFTLKHHKQYRGQTFSDTPDVNPVLPELSKLSFELLQAKKYVFNKKDLQEAVGEEGVTKVIESGIIHSIPGCSTGPFSVETKYCFIHLTFQEFLAAHYLVKKRIANGYTIIQNTIEQNLDVVVQMVSGLLKTAPPSDKPHELLSFIVEKLIISNKSLLAIKCMFEFGSSSFAKQVVQQHDFTDLRLRVNDSDCAALAFLLLLDVETNHKTEFLDLHGSSITCVGMRYVKDALKSPNCCIESLTLNLFQIDDESAKYLSEALSSGHCTLQELAVCGNNIGAEGAKYLSEALSSGHCTLQELAVSGNNIDDESAKYLSEALSSGHCTLQKLFLYHNNIGDEGAKYLSEALSSGHCTLQKLFVHDNNIGDEGAKYLSEALSSGHCTLQELNVSFNNIGDEGAKYLSEALSSGHCTLQVLDVTRNNIGAKGAKYLSEALSSGHCTLQKLFLYQNNIGDEGAKYLSEALSSGHCTLQELNVSHNNIGVEGDKYLSEALSSGRCTGLTINSIRGFLKWT